VTSRQLLSLFSAFLILGLLVSAGKPPTISERVAGAILPHHLLVEGYLEAFYQHLREQIPGVTRIILISPNHFNYGYFKIRTTDGVFLNSELFPSTPPLDMAVIRAVTDSSPLSIENTDFTKEHGVMVHLPFIAEHFPEASVVPIILKEGTSEAQLDMLASALIPYRDDHTLVLGSIDFTHYEAEAVALTNDARTIQWLERLSSSWPLKSDVSLETLRSLAQTTNSNPASLGVAMDSSESLYLVSKILEGQNALHFNLWKRTSSASFTGVDRAELNTSHLFGTFSQ